MSVAPDVRTARFAGLDTATLYALLRLRAEVFVVEQTCAFNDLDGRDTELGTRFVWAELDGVVAAGLRILTEPDGATRIGRVVTDPRHRGQGMAARLIHDALALTTGAVVLDAQSYLTAWYAGMGFVVDGDEYLDDGIPHTPMRLTR